ncbi:Lsr2 protein [Branchiibius hedensis]|uniref:Lsr2 protein n=1 Tax=Branchiibius hedensis TaxID=672460 RepID=A0A2Y8ZKJ6_9MICO|nr:Lsr2 family protein [Branchiibius hedensis]PWJ24113.1 Lsr2 protein [Branchiibius hedensis]SSA32931.1 Lsr2 protein [Branchiibius hedensis]
MAQRTQIITISDLSRVEVVDGESIPFSFRGVDYVIDLTAQEAKEFDEALALYTGHAQRVGGRKQRASSGTSSATGADREQLAKIREWAKDHGYQVAERGRIKSEVLDAYEAAHKR